ncbi:MAG: cyclopropane-fatty-acyl-phospholipid synthase family protein [Lysobacterales bacterium]
MKAQRQSFDSTREREADTLKREDQPGNRTYRTSTANPALPSGRVNSLDRLVANQLLKFLGQPAIRMVLWDGSTVASDVTEPLATLIFRDRGSLYLTIKRPELHWGDLYSQGRVDVEGDLVALLDSVYRGLQTNIDRGWLDLLNKLRTHGKIRNSLPRAADNIHHHYDIGNDFYRLWLDREAMQYTCAYYPDPAMTLEAAQLAKMAHVCRKLQLKPGDEVVEAGCGWGGFALYMAKHHNVRVKAYNISREQVAYARENARAEGLADRVEYVLDDYRNISGDFDVFVSVGMLEHVGPGDYPVLGKVIDSCLRPGGRGLIHSIGRNRPKPINAWIERRIFPGSYPPTLHEMMAIFETRRFSVLDVENLRLHYALTLGEWLQRFEQSAEQVEDMMDERFVRAWRLYLAGSKAAFTSGQLQLFQVVFAREDDNDIPWSRGYQYTTAVSHTNSDPVVTHD